MLTLGYITSRKEPHLDWFFDSLRGQEGVEAVKQIVVVDHWAQPSPDGSWTQAQADERVQSRNLASRLLFYEGWDQRSLLHVPPKPTVWAGPHRLTQQDWWHASDARNTWLCMATQPWCIALDDRCVIQPGWLSAIMEAVKGEYAVYGAYEKHWGMKVEGGVIVDPGKTDSVDHRERWCREQDKVMPWRCPPEWSFGCNLAFPTEWGMEVNGWDETCDGAGFEDCFFGIMLKNCGKRMRYDYRCKVIQDRTPSECADSLLKRDKGVSPNDKSHAIQKMLSPLKRSMHQWDLPTVRAEYRATGKWPVPTGPDRDWYDGEFLKDMTL